MDSAVTEIEFAQQLSYMARECSAWAGDCLGSLDPNRPISQESAARFIQGIRDRLARLEAYLAARQEVTERDG